MPKIMVHSCENRSEYVNDFLVPLLTESGVKISNIEVYTDHGDGCLKSYVKAFESLGDLGDYTWHLQDDVLPTLSFCDMADGLLKIYSKDAIICGFGNKEFYNDSSPWYPKNGVEMFYSFPCIGIPNYISIAFVEWLRKVNNEPKYAEYIVHNKFVDYLFKLFIGDNKTKYKIVNFRPCLVEHVDEYVGGSTIGNKRPKPAKAIMFDDEEALNRLKRWHYAKRQGH